LEEVLEEAVPFEEEAYFVEYSFDVSVVAVVRDGNAVDVARAKVIQLLVGVVGN